MIEVTGIDHIVLHVTDIERARTFYTDVLGMSVYRQNDRQVFLHAGTQGVALFRKHGDAPLATGNDLNHLALSVRAAATRPSRPSSRSTASPSRGAPGKTAASTSRIPTAIACS
jgi:catechol 2,3-dioxygenase-like lactoylglutathione lyase family enzyme